MDIALFSGQSRRQWADTMINLEARKLVNTANMVAAMHLSDSLNRLKFVDEIRQVVMQQFDVARRARNDEECITCMKNLRAENEYLLEQSRMLKTGYARILFLRFPRRLVTFDSLDILTGESCRYEFLVFHCHSRLL